MKSNKPKLDDHKNIKVKTELTLEDPDKYVFIPLQSNDIYDRSDTFRIWSCIYLAHLLRCTMISINKNEGMDDARLGGASDSNGYQYKNGRTLRGKYLTRRTQKTWWKTLKKDMKKLEQRNPNSLDDAPNKRKLDSRESFDEVTFIEQSHDPAFDRVQKICPSKSN